METWKEHQRSKKDKKWMKFQGGEDQDQDQPQELQEEDVEGVEAEEQKREEEKMKDLEVRVFRIVLPMISKNSNEVMNTAIEMLLRFKVDGYDVNRIHTNRGKEFMGAFKRGQELAAVGVLVEELLPGVVKKVFSGSQSALMIVGKEGGAWRTRHLRLRSAYARQAVHRGEWSLEHIPGESMVADLGTTAIVSSEDPVKVHA